MPFTFGVTSRRALAVAAAVLALPGCGVFRSPSTDIKPASSEVGSTTTTKVRVIPRAPETPPCEASKPSD